MLSPRCDLRFELLRSDGRLIITYPECIYKYFEGCVKINIALLLEFQWNKTEIEEFDNKKRAILWPFLMKVED